MWHCSRTRATGMMCASMVASRRSTHPRACTRCTASSSAASLTTEGTCSYAWSQPRISLSRYSIGRSPIPVTWAPTARKARANSRWFAGNDGSTKITCMSSSVAPTEISRNRYAGQPGVKFLVLRSLDAPGVVLGHSVAHQLLPDLLVLVDVERGGDRPGHRVGVVVLEDEAGPLAGGRVVELHGIRQSPRLAHDRHRPVAEAVHLVEPARLVARRHQEHVRPRFDQMGETVAESAVEDDLDGEIALQRVEVLLV